MKFEFIKQVDGTVLSYGNEVKTGDVVDLPPHFARKAARRPNDYRKVDEAKRDASVAASVEASEEGVTENKPRRGRKPKVKDGNES